MAGWASGWEELRVTWATGNAWEFHLSPGPPSSHGAKCCPGKTRRERPAEHGFLHPRPFVTTLRGGQSVLAQEHEGFGGGLLLQPSLNAAPASPCCLTLMYPNLGEDALLEMEEEDGLEPDGSTAKPPIYGGPP